MATKVTYVWIKKGTDKLIPTTTSRNRVNLFGSDLARMTLITQSYDSIDSKALAEIFEQLSLEYPLAPKIHLILDTGSYNMSKETREASDKYKKELHHLPAYSLNLNPIERVWNIMNEHVRNNKFLILQEGFEKM
jgi:transposase